LRDVDVVGSKIRYILSPFVPTVVGLGLTAALLVDAVRTSPILCAAMGSVCSPIRRAPLGAPFGAMTPMVGFLGFALLGVLSLVQGMRTRLVCCVIAFTCGTVGLGLVGAQLWKGHRCLCCVTADLSAFAAGALALGRFQVRWDIDGPLRAARAASGALLATAAGGVVAVGLLVQARVAAGLHEPRRAVEGKALFATYCIPCHGPDGGGKMGPNLTDSAWIHGSSPEQIFAEIANGTPDKGMVPWAPLLGANRVMALTAFVLNIKNTDVPGGKAPQGTVEK
jgi:mono/diheme cytochrome c family protein